MANKTAFGQNGTGGNRLTYFGSLFGAVCHLSDDTYVSIDIDPGASAASPNHQISLNYVTGALRNAKNVIYLPDTNNDFAYASFAVCRDNVDNIYVIGRSNAASDAIRAQAYAKGVGLTWTPKTVLTAAAIPGVSPGAFGGNFQAYWLNTGGGTNGKGHILLTGHYNSGSVLHPFAVTLDAGALLAGAGTLLANSYVPATFLGGGGTTTPYGASSVGMWIDFAPDGFGVPHGLGAGSYGWDGINHKLSIGRWAVSAAGALTTNVEISHTVEGANNNGLKVRVLWISSDLWAVAYTSDVNSNRVKVARYSSTAQLTAAVESPNFATTLAANGYWDAFVASGKVSVLAWSSATPTTLWRLQAAVTAGVVWDGSTTVFDTGIGVAGSNNYDTRTDPNFLGAVVDVDTYNSATGPTYGLLGDFLTLNQPPNAPALVSPVGNVVVDRGITQRLSWTFSDPDTGDSQSKFDLQWRLGAGAWTTITTTTPNNYTDVSGGTFPAGSIEWQVRTYDSVGVVGPWSASGFFTAASPPPAPVITVPVNNSVIAVITSAVTWSAPNQDSYELRRVADLAGAADPTTVYYDSGEVVEPATRTRSVDFPTNSRYEHVQVRVKYQGLWSTWADARVQISWLPPTVPTIALVPSDALAKINIAWTNPAPGGATPATAYNDIYRRKSGTSDWTRIATNLPQNSNYDDYGVASGQAYDYKVVAVSTTTTTSDSAVAASSITLRGMWLQDPTNVVNTIHKFMFDANRTVDWRPELATNDYEGRVLPVAEFGTSEDVAITLTLPLDMEEFTDVTAMTALVKLKRPLLYRDGKGAKYYVIIPDLKLQEPLWNGRVMAFSAFAVDYTEAV
jgi:hypothetical protein